MGNDIWIVIQWWAVLFLIGAAAFPLTKALYFQKDGFASRSLGEGWFDQGYLFSKAVGLAVVTWLVYAVGTVHIAPFTAPTMVIALGVVFGVGMFLATRDKRQETSKTESRSGLLRIAYHLSPIFCEELFFFLALLLWSWVKGHEPSIHGLEKFMDFGFTQSILNSFSFPVPDMWYSGYSINYYYFGHIAMAILTKFSGLDLAYTFNLMLATMFAFTVTMSFSIGKQICQIGHMRQIWQTVGGLLTAFLVTLAGNLQTIYAFTRGYTGDPPAGGSQPFWELLWNIKEIGRIGEGLNTYWYANATRFIPFSIHEFPSYSFVVSDVHGHVLSLPFVLLAISLLIQMVIGNKREVTSKTKNVFLISYRLLLFYGFLVGVLLMTNALDGPIYFALAVLVLVIIKSSNNSINQLSNIKTVGVQTITIAGVAIFTSLPFLLHFKSFVSGLAVNCPPAFLANTKIGPILFEGVEKCQHSPVWMMALLWGFFIYCGLGLLVKLGKFGKLDKLLMVFFFFSVVLIIFPEFFYFKDIYPAHFRSNTMFKLGYQAFILFSIVSGYVIVQTVYNLAKRDKRLSQKIFFILLLPQLFLVSIYPIFSVRSYFNSLKTYEGLDGLAWFKRQYPDDWKAIEWMNQAIRDKRKEIGKTEKYSDLSLITYRLSPVLLEADGDSYTDYARFSAFTGVPTVIGWAVHEWLWRGSYDVVSPRREDVRLIYESRDASQTRELLMKYGVTHVIVGTLEREKYVNLHEGTFAILGRAVFRSGRTVLYEINK